MSDSTETTAARPKARSLIPVGRAVLAHARATQVPTLAAAVAYYAFVSLLPLVIVGFTLASLIAGEAVAARIVAATGELLSDSGESLIDQALTQGTGRGGTTIIGLAVLAWSGLRLFRGLDTAFSLVYGTADDGSLVSSVRDAVVVFTASGAALVGTALVGGVAAFGTGPAGAVLGPLGLVAGMTLVFLPMFYVFPDDPVTVREIAPGAVSAAVGWGLLNVVFVAYAALASASAYGVLGAVLLLVTWFYFAALILLLGATLNVVLAEF